MPTPRRWPLQSISPISGATTAEKLRGTKVWVRTLFASAPCEARGRAGMGAGEGRPLPCCWGPGYYPRKIVENADAKSCILVTTTLISGLLGRVYPCKQQACQGLNQFHNFNFSAVVAPLVVKTKKNTIKWKLQNNTCCEISCSLKTTAKKCGDQYTVGPPTSELGDQSTPVHTVGAPMSPIRCSYTKVKCMLHLLEDVVLVLHRHAGWPDVFLPAHPSTSLVGSRRQLDRARTGGSRHRSRHLLLRRHLDAFDHLHRHFVANLHLHRVKNVWLTAR